MQSTGSILSRMRSIRQTVQITNAQKLIAASKIVKAKRMIADAEPYHSHIRETIAGMLAAYPDAAPEHLSGSGDRLGMLIISAEAGLAGGYNTNLLKFSDAEYAKQPVSKLLVQGKIGAQFYEKRGIEVDDGFELIFHGHPTISYAGRVSKYILTLTDEIDSFDVVYTYYQSAAKQTPVRVRLFPLSGEIFETCRIFPQDVEFEPSPEAVISALAPKYLTGFIYGALVHAYASELASRVSAMDSAMRNGNDMLDRLSLAYNRARQAAITQEITEIVAGAEAIAT